MKTVIQTLQKYATGKLVSIMFVLTMIVYCTMIFYSIPAVSNFAPEYPIFDLSPTGYSFDYANNLLNALGEQGRHLYKTLQLPLDFIYPGLFAVAYSLLLIWLFCKTIIRESKIVYLAFIPFLAGVFDYLENIFIVKMINAYPDIQNETVKLASTFTVIKSLLTLTFFVLLIVGFVLLLKQKLLKTRN